MLRFPEFSENWFQRKLQEVGKITTGSTPSTANREFYDGEHLFVSPADISDSRVIHKTKTTVTGLGLNQGRIVKKGAVFFVSIGSTIGKVGQASRSCITNQQINSVEATSKFSNDFIYYLLSKNGDKIKLLAGTQALPQLNKSDFSKLEFSFPSLPEQQKIAEFLTAVDRRIELLQAKKEKLEAYKKGVMQKIFSQQLRFKADDGSEFPDWEERKLGDLGKTFNGLTGKSKENFGQGKPYIQYKQIFDSSEIKAEDFGLVEVSENESQSKVQKGDVFFTTSSETPHEIGMASVLTNDVGEVYLNSFCFGYRPNSIEKLLPEFSRYFFRSPIVRRGIVKLAQGSTRYNMSKVELMRLSFEIPSPKEQLKIAKFLTSLDRSIEILNQQINHTQTWKKGLLQKMFV